MRGDIDVRIHTMGELGPRRSMTIASAGCSRSSRSLPPAASSRKATS
jgi:hypothetical protein